MDRLTTPQRKTLDFIHDAILACGAPPTLREICDHMEFASIGSVQDVVAALRKKGFLEVPDKQVARALILTNMAEGLYAVDAGDDELSDDVWTLPCLGAVPAGNPVEAIEARVGVMSFSAGLLPRPRPRRESLFGLRAKGESMIGAGILDGDWLVVQSRSEAPVGTIVVAKVEEEITVKRLMQDRRRGLYLQPENEAFQPIFGGEQPFSIVGRVVALQRQFE